MENSARKTSLYAAHEKAGAKIVEFAGFSMPIQYNEGILKEHLTVRENAGVFDVSHMGQAILSGKNCAEFIEKISPSSFAEAKEYAAKYTVLTNDQGSIIDDLIITKLNAEKFFFVYNAGTREKDEKWILSRLPLTLKFEPLKNRSLLAVQGRRAEETLSKIFPEGNFSGQNYMTLQIVNSAKYGEVFISRLGYTGEDGFEISMADDKAGGLWQAIIENGVKPIGLGARDSLRLEMGYPLYGHDINDQTTPLEANLGWIMPKAKRENLPKPKKLRVGFEINDRSIIREGVEIYADNGKKIGVVTSGGFSPTLQKPIAQGYVDAEFASSGTPVNFELRGRKIAGKVGALNFIKPKTKSAK